MGPALLPMLVLGGLAAAGSLVSANAAAGQYESEAAAARVNARMAGQQANQREEQIRRENRMQMGEQAAAIAQSGTGPGGSNALIVEQSATNAELDALNTRYEGQVRRTSFLNQAAGAGYAARSARLGGWMGAATSMFDGVDRAAARNFNFGN
jgi:hypothetical protein